MPAAGGSGGGSTSDDKYEIRVRILEQEHIPSSEVKAQISVNNKRSLPKYFVDMTYYLEDANGTRWDEVRETLPELQPGYTVINRSLQLPAAAEIGQWKFVVEYDLFTTREVSDYDTFEVVKNIANMDIIKIIILTAVIFFMINRFPKTPDESEELDIGPSEPK